MAVERRRLTVQAATRLLLGLVCVGLLVFAPAGTLRFWPGWAWCAAIFGPMPVVLANSYASRTLGVDPGQKVIDHGPYAWVRHPMYSAVTLMMVATPTALGSTWALPMLAIFPLVLIRRIREEEALLRAELPGYAEYCARVRSRMIPGIW